MKIDTNEIGGWVSACVNVAQLRTLKAHVNHRLAELGQPAEVPPPLPLSAESVVRPPARPPARPAAELSEAELIARLEELTANRPAAARPDEVKELTPWKDSPAEPVQHNPSSHEAPKEE